MEDLRTPFVIEKEARELEIFNEFNRLAGQPGAMKTRVSELVSEKYKLHSKATLHNIRKRVEKRLANVENSVKLTTSIRFKLTTCSA
ncbi:hypothetical protein [Dyadobacter fermentans]|uniref:hypothetical protein n=1 Tax=Dyadobacter fermentans TaxID=94254 RepID=UPI001CBD211C|nr:hypothetical protein [Dyadobacter fermentans]MBZ1361647.1 hypothetical protein [Dyadobacter fermentans]